MTIEWIKMMLKIAGINSKYIVLTALEEASKEELIELRNSISELIRSKSGVEE